MPQNNQGPRDPVSRLFASAPLPRRVQKMIIERFGRTAGWLRSNPFLDSTLIADVFELVNHPGCFENLAEFTLTVEQLDELAALLPRDIATSTMLLRYQKLTVEQATAVCHAQFGVETADQLMFSPWLPSSAKMAASNLATPRARAAWIANDENLNDEDAWEMLTATRTHRYEFSRYTPASLAMVLAGHPGLRERFVELATEKLLARAWCALVANGVSPDEQLAVVGSLHRFSDYESKATLISALDDDPSTIPEVIAQLDDVWLSKGSHTWTTGEVDVRGLGIELGSLNYRKSLDRILSRSSTGPQLGGLRPFQWLRLAENPYLDSRQHDQVVNHIVRCVPYLGLIASTRAGTALGTTFNPDVTSVLNEPLARRNSRTPVVPNIVAGQQVRLDGALTGECAAYAGAYLASVFQDDLDAWQTAFSLLQSMYETTPVTAGELTDIVCAARQ